MNKKIEKYEELLKKKDTEIKIMAELLFMHEAYIDEMIDNLILYRETAFNINNLFMTKNNQGNNDERN